MSGSVIRWGVAKLAVGGQGHSGDSYIVCESPKGVLMAVVDGLGHGEEAEEAARMATNVVHAHNHEGLIPILRRCHEALRLTRGAVMSLAWISEATEEMTWAGVGNVEGLLVRADPQANPQRESLLLRPGVLGDQLPTPHAAITPLSRGDTIILTTDGVRHDFARERVRSDQAPQQIAEQILSEYGRGDDDVLVLVARYKGGGP